MKESTRQMCEIQFKDGSKHIYYWNGRIYRKNKIFLHPSTTTSYNNVDFSKSFIVSASNIASVTFIKEVTRTDSKKRVKYLRDEKQTQPSVPTKTLKEISKEITESLKGNRWNYLEL